VIGDEAISVARRRNSAAEGFLIPLLACPLLAFRAARIAVQ
jgi:hypothetical protein